MQNPILLNRNISNLTEWVPSFVIDRQEEVEKLFNLSTPLIGPFSNLTAQKVDDWGPKRDSLYIVIPITIIYVLTFISGIIGNVSTCIVIARNKSMHTATNYYLFSLAVSDLLLLVAGLPQEIYIVWSRFPYVFGEAFCVLQGFAAETSANATVLTITAFTVERYVAICHPFISHTLSKLNRAVKFIIVIWVIALCLAIPPAMSFGVVYEEINGTIVSTDHCTCMVARTWIPHAFEISTCVFFVTPMSLITVLYVLIGLQLHRSTVGPSRGNSVKLKHRIYKPVVTYSNAPAHAVLVLNDNDAATEKLQQNNQEEEGRKNFAKNAQATKHVVKMLIAVVVAFFICWAPFHAQRLFAIYGDATSPKMSDAYKVLTYISGVFYFLSTSVNPILYHIMSHKFREAFKNTFKQCFRRGRSNPGGRCYANLSGRSSQVNSHSNTDSYSRQSSLRYLDAEMARLHDSRRPLVVSFRRKTSTTSATGTTGSHYHQQGHHYYRHRPKHYTSINGDLQEVLDCLNEDKAELDCDYFGKRLTTCWKHKKARPLSDVIAETTIHTECSFVDVHSLQPTHICPLSNSACELPSLESLKLENMAIFQKKLLDLSNVRNGKGLVKSRPYSVDFKTILDEINDKAKPKLCKSSTMPDISGASQMGSCPALKQSFVEETHKNGIVRQNENRVTFVSNSNDIDKTKSNDFSNCISNIISSQYSDNLAIHVS